MDLFSETTHALHWIYEPKKLAQLRNETTQAAHQRLLKWASKQSLAVDTLETEQYQNLVNYYESRVKDFCKAFKLKLKTELTCILLLKRFFVSASVVEYDPKIIFVVCLFLATKIEHDVVSLEDYLKKIPKVTISDFQMRDYEVRISNEMMVSETLGFEYMIQHPDWPAHGFYLDIQSFIWDDQELTAKQECINILKSVYEKVMAHLKNIYISDIPLLYHPAQIALASFQYFANDLLGQIINTYKQNRFSDKLDDLESNLSKILNDLGRLEHQKRLLKKENIEIISKKINVKYQNMVL